MRTALRTSIVTAALAGAMLAPAAGAAFAATAAPAESAARTAAASTSGTVGDNSRYEGKPVYIGEGLVAVLRNKAEGPEAWIREVGTQWKPGDNYMLHPIAVLSRKQTTAAANGLHLQLTKVDTAAPVLVVTKEGGASKSYPLPKGRATSPADCVSPVKTVRLGEFMTADLTMSPKGPKAFVVNLEGLPDPRTLDRTHPNGSDPDSLRIDNPSGANPVLRWKYESGDAAKTASFPALPKGCKLDYKITGEQGTKPAPKPKPQPQTQTGTQTVVVPKGPVAAGAELPVETVADTDNTATLVAGAGLIAVFGALGASVVLRRRRAQD
ncbi:hypothetical protein [Streptomyces sp. TBY4]|uniref:hypothetical protein n=1 Tax=Streptomyces sp. TBY4 TaxID=2962030 RepID=UPI0020B81954|nr:hypothetical protein [Streptomyces sp. TBY4]MCP3755495.1 hypothetical protein [Streptomyces sp. TBY4]